MSVDGFNGGLMKLLRVDLDRSQVQWTPVPEIYEHLGGRALIVKILLEEVPPECDAMGTFNKLILAPGLLAGAGVTTAGRLSIGGKSPLTGGVKESNVGGTAGDALGKYSIKAMIIEGQVVEGEWSLVHVKNDGIDIVACPDLLGKGTYETSAILQTRFGGDCTVVCIGQAGEQRMTGAGICATGEGNQRSNFAARGGLGALMGGKGLKAIVIDKPVGKSVSLVDVELFRSAARTFAQKLINDPKLGTKGSQHLYGTASIVAPMNEIGSLPTRNFSHGNFEGFENLRGEFLRELTIARGGEVGTRCMPGCVIACRNSFVDQSGKAIVGTVQYETIALLGSNLGLDSLDEIAQLNYLCNDFGLDTIETGAALGVAIEAGLAKFGDFDSIKALLLQVGQGTKNGCLIGCGAVATGRALKIARIPAVLGQAIPGYDPRSLKGNGVTYATSPQGADHTAGNAFGSRKDVNPLQVEGQRQLSLKLQIIAAMLDSTGICLFARPPIIIEPQIMLDMLNGRYGWNWTIEDYDRANRTVLRDELEFNRRAGIKSSDYRLPKYMHEEKLPPHHVVFDVPDSELDKVFEDL
jgi:aldehyde:ferredoxin oxidoreductase